MADQFTLGIEEEFQLVNDPQFLLKRTMKDVQTSDTHEGRKSLRFRAR